MGLYEQIKEIAINKGYSINRLEKELGFARSSISKFNKNVPSMEKIKQIADLLEVSTDCILSGNVVNGGIFTCPDCGLSYNLEFLEDIEEHEREHSAWEKATEKFGKLYCVTAVNEKIKAENRNISRNPKFSLEERFSAQLIVFRCLFSRSVINSGYNLKHVPFEKYVAMMLGNETYKNTLENSLYEAFVREYGILPGINFGSIYQIRDDEPTTIAAHFDGSEYTEEELDEIRQFAEFVKNRRK